MSNDPPEEMAGDGTDNGTPLPLETVFQVLENQRRRVILYYLTTCTYPVPFKELVEEVAEQESETQAAEGPTESYEQVAVDLHHTQLPKLAQWGVIEYNTEMELITVAETLRPLDEYLQLAKQHDQQEEPYDRP